MATATNKSAKSAASALPKSIFDVDVNNHELLKLAYDRYLSNSRAASAVTKTRGEVRGGGKKPWRQKGTGRARFGSTRNPIWRTGGVVFGPRGIESYTKAINKQAKRIATRQALTLAHRAGKVSIIDGIQTNGKTREFVEFLRSNDAATTSQVLIAVDQKIPELIRAASNLQSVLLVGAMYLSVYHILNADKIIITSAALDQIEQWLDASAGQTEKAGK